MSQPANWIIQKDPLSALQALLGGFTEFKRSPLFERAKDFPSEMLGLVEFMETVAASFGPGIFFTPYLLQRVGLKYFIVTMVISALVTGLLWYLGCVLHEERCKKAGAWSIDSGATPPRPSGWGALKILGHFGVSLAFLSGIIEQFFLTANTAVLSWGLGVGIVVMLYLLSLIVPDGVGGAVRRWSPLFTLTCILLALVMCVREFLSMQSVSIKRSYGTEWAVSPLTVIIGLFLFDVDKPIHEFTRVPRGGRGLLLILLLVLCVVLPIHLLVGVLGQMIFGPGINRDLVSYGAASKGYMAILSGLFFADRCVALFNALWHFKHHSHGVAVAVLVLGILAKEVVLGNLGAFAFFAGFSILWSSWLVPAWQLSFYPGQPSWLMHAAVFSLVAIVIMCMYSAIALNTLLYLEWVIERQRAVRRAWENGEIKLANSVG